jgi:hypothetical protein
MLPTRFLCFACLAAVGDDSKELASTLRYIKRDLLDKLHDHNASAAAAYLSTFKCDNFAFMWSEAPKDGEACSALTAARATSSLSPNSALHGGNIIPWALLRR